MKISNEVLNERINGLEKIVYEIKDNHLHELKDDIGFLSDKLNKVELKIAYWTGGAAVAGMVVNGVVQLLK